MLLHNVMCSGYEYRLLDCHNLGIERSGCGHDRDAGVVCSTGKCIRKVHVAIRPLQDW